MADAVSLTDAQYRILRALRDRAHHPERSLLSSSGFLQRMWARGWINGGFKSNLGRTPDDRFWWITADGAAVLDRHEASV